MFTLSIILNLHREGILAERTIRNFLNIIEINKKLYKSWDEIEILAILDNSDEETKNVVYNNKNLFFKIDEVCFKDLALSRNYGITQSTKNFILFADGDDYFSHNVLEELFITFYKYYNNISSTADLKNLPDNQHIVVFPSYYIEFPNLLKAKYSDSTDFTIQNNKFIHCYGSRIATYKGILEKYKVYENKTPYGYEDWDLNNRLMANGIKFKISNFKLYYRRENSESLLAMQIKNKSIVRNSLLYNYLNINSNLESMNEKLVEERLPIQSKKRGFIWRSLAKSHTLKKIYDFLKNVKNNMTMKTQPLAFDYFEDDILFLENYGERVCPRENTNLYSLEYFSSYLSIQTKVYNQLLEFLGNKEIVYFFPWIVLGGADKVSVEYTKALSSKNFCVITSISSGSRIENINAPHLDLITGIDGWESLSEENKLHILIKALINSNIKLIHVVNSEIALKTIKYYNKVYEEYNIKTIVSMFCPEYHWDNKEWHGFPVMYPELFNNSNMILLDNHYWYDFFKKLNKDNDFKYSKLSSPTEKLDITYSLKKYETKKILWASRICNQKLFGIFEKIIDLTPEYIFVIYGSVEEEDYLNKAILNRLLKKNNVEFRGTYEHISELNLDEFDLYLFTSLYEGIPTIILDMVMGGIPIVSARVGGIQEVLGEDYPLLVDNESVATDYVSKIKEFYINKYEVVERIFEIRNIVLQEYNKETFQNEYNNLIKNILNENEK